MKKILLILMAMLAFGIQNVSAQDAPLKIVTNHPDFKVKVKRCAASGKTVVLDLVLNNDGVNDVENVISFGGAIFGDYKSEAYDDEGNIYKGDDVKIKVANSQDYSKNTGKFNILSGVPMRISIRIDGVSQSAESIARLKLMFECKTWGLDYHNPVIFSNIPISRD